MSAYDRLIAAGAEHWAFGIHGTKGDENVNAALDRIAAPSPALTRAPTSDDPGVWFCVCGMGWVGRRGDSSEVRSHAEFRVSGGEPGADHDPGLVTFRADTPSKPASPALTREALLTAEAAFDRIIEFVKPGFPGFLVASDHIAMWAREGRAALSKIPPPTEDKPWQHPRLGVAALRESTTEAILEEGRGVSKTKMHPSAEPLRRYCGDCDGVGWVEGGETLQTTCKTCGGSGWAPV